MLFYVFLNLYGFCHDALNHNTVCNIFFFVDHFNLYIHINKTCISYFNLVKHLDTTINIILIRFFFIRISVLVLCLFTSLTHFLFIIYSSHVRGGVSSGHICTASKRPRLFPYLVIAPIGLSSFSQINTQRKQVTIH